MRERTAALGEEQPTADDIEAIAQATKEFRRGKYITLNQLRDELGRRRRRRVNKPPARSRRNRSTEQ